MISNPTYIAYDDDISCKAVLVTAVTTALTGTSTCTVVVSSNVLTVTIPEGEIGGENELLSNPRGADSYAIAISGVRVSGYE
jgi:hypothetical protein